MRRTVLVSLATGMMFLTAGQAQATELTANTGWQDDLINVPGAPTVNSPWTFTIAKAGILSVVDTFIPGDFYTLSGDLTGTTTFYAGSPGAIQATGTDGSLWTNAAYSKLALSVAPGSYSFSITGGGEPGAPKALALRLDVSEAPEPASWVMMTGAFGALGIALRRRRRHVRSFC